jgi:putative phosphoribosyl transferase
VTFANRKDAGSQLGTKLLPHRPPDPVVVGLYRGGVPVAAELARVLDAPLEICVVRSLLVPGNPPLTIGAIAEGGALYVDEARAALHGVSADAIQELAEHAATEVARLAELIHDRPPIDVRGRDVILVDDGITTGNTIRAAARALRLRGARRLDLAVPVGSAEVVEALRPELDRVLCLIADPALTPAIGAWYGDFWPVSDAEVIGVVARWRREHAPHAGA